MIKNYVNHVAFLLDGSSSCASLRNKILEVFNLQVKHLARRSQELDQESRISVWVFGNDVKCILWERDCLRPIDISSSYQTSGQTALIDAVVDSIEEFSKIPVKYGDHSFLIYGQTDGQENNSRKTPEYLAQTIKNLPGNWTLGLLVPDITAVHEAKKFGFSKDCIQVWSTTEGGVEEVGKTVIAATDRYMVARSKGVTGSKNLFSIKTDNLTTKAVVQNLKELKAGIDYNVYPVRVKAVIKDFVESWTKTNYVPSSAYYELSKPEKIQANKQIAIQHKINGKVYSGIEARKLIGLPDYEINADPNTYGEWKLFIQSKSVNRNLVGGTDLLVMK